MSRKKEFAVAKLEYRSSFRDHVRARATAQAYVTPTQVVVVRGTWKVEQVNRKKGYGPVQGGYTTLRFRRKDFIPIPNDPMSFGSWRLERLIFPVDKKADEA